MSNNYMYYAFLYKYASNLTNNILSNIFTKNIHNDLRRCLDPSIPIAQYYLISTKETNQLDDLLSSLTAATTEDLNLYPSKATNLTDSAALKVAIKDTTKIICKNYLSTVIVNNPYGISFICEAIGTKTFFLTKQLLNKGPFDLDFLYFAFSESISDAAYKIPANYVKRSINSKPYFYGKYVISEYFYRSISNSIKHISNKYMPNFNEDNLLNIENILSNLFLGDLTIQDFDLELYL